MEKVIFSNQKIRYSRKMYKKLNLASKTNSG